MFTVVLFVSVIHKMFVKCANEERERERERDGVPVCQFVCPACGECTAFTLNVKPSILLASWLAVWQFSLGTSST